MVKMIIAKVITTNAGYKLEQEEIEKLGWQVGDEFVVSTIEVGGYSSKVKLEDGKYYNSCFFEFYEDGNILNIYADKRFQNSYI